jgi:hypothetical protein
MRQGMPSIRLPSESGTVEPSEAYLQTHYRLRPLHRNYAELFLRYNCNALQKQFSCNHA